MITLVLCLMILLGYVQDDNLLTHRDFTRNDELCCLWTDAFILSLNSFLQSVKTVSNHIKTWIIIALLLQVTRESRGHDRSATGNSNYQLLTSKLFSKGQRFWKSLSCSLVQIYQSTFFMIQKTKIMWINIIIIHLMIKFKFRKFPNWFKGQTTAARRGPITNIAHCWTLGDGESQFK